jgi:hypothetical protein
MRRLELAMMSVAGAMILLGGGRSAVEAIGSQDPKISWITDKKQAFDQARKTGKPIWALFR